MVQLEELYTTEQTCALLHIGKTTLYRLGKQGKLVPVGDSTRKNFYTEEAIRAYDEQRRQPKNLYLTDGERRAKITNSRVARGA